MVTRNGNRVARGRQERGIALLTALFALLLISGIAFGMMYMANTETAINYNYRDLQKAEYAAFAGLQEVRARLTSGVTNQITALPTALPSTTAGIVYLRNPRGSETIDPTSISNAYFDTELCHEGFPGLNLTETAASTANMPCTTAAPSAAVSYVSSIAPDTGTNAAMAYKWVRITWKNNQSSGGDTGHAWLVTGSSGTPASTQICWDGQHETLLPADGRANCDAAPVGVNNYYYTQSVYMITALAVTPSGARKMMQVEAALNPPLITNAAIDTNDFVNTSGSSVTINGYDNCNCSCTTAKGQAVPTCTNRVTGGGCTGSTYAIFTSQTVSSSGSPAIIAGTDPPVAQNQTFPYDVPSLISSYKSAPGAVNTSGPPYNMNCTGTPANCGNYSGGGGTPTFGSAPNPFPPTNVSNPPGEVDQITYVPGSLDLQAHPSGAGVLIVDGDLTIHGGIDFYGLILVRGVLTFSGSGQGQAVNVIGGVLSGAGSVADSLSGGVNIQFDHCALLHNQVAAPPKNLGLHALAY